ncbi:TetR/AcrR family transcriptional regulator [Nesterenkonia ebinurensis]|uniref:TetR/AcrR family transcriptional regulator n=1 Tax=Nesterenkonia ebinurensis TaxID=2608252 RepID=UPI00168BC37A|nr:TetR/AcrR family transcriptional regulator [Nesterenkonia ebinurensis]
MQGSITRTRASDPRPVRTRKTIYAAVEALSTTGTRDVTVAAIAREAGISRPAFYAQFSDMDDLAVSMLVEAFSEIGAADLAKRRADATDKRGAALQAARRLMFHIDGRRSFYRAALGWKISTRAREAVTEAYGRHVAASMDLAPGSDAIGQSREDLVKYISGGTIALLMAWLLDTTPAPPEEMAERLLAVMPSWLVGEKV